MSYRPLVIWENHEPGIRGPGRLESALTAFLSMDLFGRVWGMRIDAFGLAF